MKDKKVITEFEYAIRKIAEPETLHNYRPLTQAEQLARRKQKIRNQLNRFKIKTVKK